MLCAIDGSERFDFGVADMSKMAFGLTDLNRSAFASQQLMYIPLSSHTVNLSTEYQY